MKVRREKVYLFIDKNKEEKIVGITDIRHRVIEHEHDKCKSSADYLWDMLEEKYHKLYSHLNMVEMFSEITGMKVVK